MQDINIYALEEPAVALFCDASFHRKDSLTAAEGEAKPPMYCYFAFAYDNASSIDLPPGTEKGLKFPAGFKRPGFNPNVLPRRGLKRGFPLMA